MWRLFQRELLNTAKRLGQLSVADLYSQLVDLPEKPIILDIRGRLEIQTFPYIIPGALLATNVSFSAMIPWIPPQSTVVVYASDDIPDNGIPLRVISLVSKGYALNGGLRAWHQARLPLESVAKYQWCSR
jgi:hypothetical protein